jgi:hypothetical protein
MQRIVITRGGETTVYTGWRAWLIVAAASIVAAVAIVILAFLLLGIAVTVAALLLFVVPLAILFALVASWFQSTRSR